MYVCMSVISSRFSFGRPNRHCSIVRAWLSVVGFNAGGVGFRDLLYCLRSWARGLLVAGPLPVNIIG
jgi:hypothetical protein